MPTRSYISALLLLVGTIALTLIGCASVFLVNPYSIFGASTMTVAPTVTNTSTPSTTPTPSMTATASPLPSATPTATVTPVPTETPTPSATPDPETFMPTTPQTAPNCGVTMIKGQVRSAETLINGVPVHVWWEGSDGVHSLPSGHDPSKPDGYWDVMLDAQAKAGRWFAAAVDPVSLAHISPAVVVETDAEPCEPESAGRQVITVDFVLQGAFVGEAGPTLTPSPTPTPTFTPTPFPTPDGQSRAVRVPILMYHYVSWPPPHANRYRNDLSVSPDDFRTHLTYLRDHGYHPISLHDLVYALTRGTPLPPKPIVLTFDDGYRDNYVNAFPMLREFGFTGTFFVVTDFITENRSEYMTWDQLREMHAAGMEIGSHSRDHSDLRNRSDEFLVWQILGSREAIEQRLGVRPEVFSYPSGRYDERVVEVVRSAHYWAAVTTSGGSVHTTEERFTLERIRVRGGWGPSDLQRVLGYWERNGQ